MVRGKKNEGNIGKSKVKNRNRRKGWQEKGKIKEILGKVKKKVLGKVKIKVEEGRDGERKENLKKH
jgi:hypothetical protein